MTGDNTDGVDPRFVPIVDMVHRTGAVDFQIRLCEEGDPPVWVAVVTHRVDGDGRPVSDGGRLHLECAAAMDPYHAVYRLAELLVDGGTCAHCGRPTGLHDDIDPMPLSAALCWYAWDPELATFRRHCEGQT